MIQCGPVVKSTVLCKDHQKIDYACWDPDLTSGLNVIGWHSNVSVQCKNKIRTWGLNGSIFKGLKANPNKIFRGLTG